MNDTGIATFSITFQIQTTATHDLPAQKTTFKCCEKLLSESSKHSVCVLAIHARKFFIPHINIPKNDHMGRLCSSGTLNERKGITSI